jgi:hypothetical protein
LPGGACQPNAYTGRTTFERHAPRPRHLCSTGHQRARPATPIGFTACHPPAVATTIPRLAARAAVAGGFASTTSSEEALSSSVARGQCSCWHSAQEQLTSTPAPAAATCASCSPFRGFGSRKAPAAHAARTHPSAPGQEHGGTVLCGTLWRSTVELRYH